MIKTFENFKEIENKTLSDIIGNHPSTENIEKYLSDFNQKVYNWVKEQIINLCKENDIYFSTGYHTIIKVHDENGEELDDTEVEKLVFWFEEFIGNFPQVMCEPDGTWYDGYK